MVLNGAMEQEELALTPVESLETTAYGADGRELLTGEFLMNELPVFIFSDDDDFEDDDYDDDDDDYEDEDDDYDDDELEDEDDDDDDDDDYEDEEDDDYEDEEDDWDDFDE